MARSTTVAAVALGLTAVVALSGSVAHAAVTALPAGDQAAPQSSHQPKPPKPPRNFTGKGRYLVPDLNINVPFTWNAKGGNTQMIAGGPKHKIWFTNLTYDGNFYTYTYKWPGVPPVACAPIPGATLAGLNKAFAGSSYVGPEILQGTNPREVDHWRLSAVLPDIRLPLARIHVRREALTI